MIMDWGSDISIWEVPYAPDKRMQCYFGVSGSNEEMTLSGNI